MDCGSLLRSYSRYMLIIFNLIFAITGIIIISVGVSAKAYFHEFDTLLDDKYFYVSDLLIIIGVIIFFIAFFGCCGAMKQNACMTTTYSSLLVMIFLLELAVGIGGVLLKNKTEDILIDTMDKTMEQYGKVNETTRMWDQVQKQFQCCGVHNASDWKTLNTTTHGQIPLSCCDIPTGTTFTFNCTLDKAYKEGCLEEFGNFVKANISTIQGVGIGFAVLQLLGIIFSCILTKFIRSDYETV
ncbi:hypothetical protein JTB14_031113 [Gonioctena quinquepunctata]|nr:hypothetical protein JTB14_031113 [Gonioctena quinquepunctata]